jgi:hypothetical protein
MALVEDSHAPTAPSERRAWLTALALLALGVGVLVAVLSGALDSTGPATVVAQPPSVLAAVRTPTTASGSSRALLSGVGAPTAGPYAVARSTAVAARGSGRAGRVASGRAGRVASAGPVVADPAGAPQQSTATSFAEATAVHIPAAWEAGFYPIYAEAQHVFDVNWLLLASIHDQESAFSTAPSTYHGLNFAHCCGGPMQFNVTNGPVSTWQLVRNAYLYGRRPAHYDHETARHPSIYDDFDAIMAAAWLLSSDGAGTALDDSAWWAAYDYYGHDATGVTYADQVLARAIRWSQHGFCINCGVESQMVDAVQEAYGAPVLESLTAATLASKRRSGRTTRRR